MNIDGLIRSSASFSEFLEKVKVLSKSRDKGDVFERFVELYLKSKPKYACQVETVWQLRDVPEEIKRNLNLPKLDEGIDLVTKNFDGTFWSIQAKFSSNSKSRLKWGGKGGLSTFTALSFSTCRNIDYGLVFSTTEKPLKKSELTGEKIGFELLSDFLELETGECEEWNRLKKCFGNRPVAPKKLVPFSHQKRAKNKAKNHYLKEGNRRGKLIMPCASGKSLTSFLIANALNSKEIIVAVPSLALIKQSLNFWTKEYLAYGIRPSFIAICSNSDVGDIDSDSFTAETYDIGIPCTTDQNVIEDFLKENSDQPKIVFTTYQSGKVLARSSKAVKHRFDLGIFDEAHKTVGRKDKIFSHLIFDENIKINKRVFMTATERHYRGSSEQIVSMNNVSHYGKTFELLTFKKAIEENIISDYRFITIGISKLEIRKMWDENKYLRLEGKELTEEKTRSLASGLAIKKVFSELGVNQAITFHRTINDSKNFLIQQDDLEKIFPEFQDIKRFNVSSKISAGERSVIMNNFAESERSLISNARCLTEGVDIPSVDCVMFVDPKESKIDIVQAVGRVLRKSKKRR